MVTNTAAMCLAGALPFLEVNKLPQLFVYRVVRSLALKSQCSGEAERPTIAGNAASETLHARLLPINEAPTRGRRRAVVNGVTLRTLTTV